MPSNLLRLARRGLGQESETGDIQQQLLPNQSLELKERGWRTLPHSILKPQWRVVKLEDQDIECRNDTQQQNLQYRRLMSSNQRMICLEAQGLNVERVISSRITIRWPCLGVENWLTNWWVSVIAMTQYAYLRWQMSTEFPSKQVFQSHESGKKWEMEEKITRKRKHHTVYTRKLLSLFVFRFTALSWCVWWRGWFL